jgi:transcriptional regulator with XRE-family HTH domain
MIDPNKLVTQLVTLREEQGISQEKLSKLTGLSSNTIARIECREHYPRLETLFKILEALKVKPSTLFMMLED